MLQTIGAPSLVEKGFSWPPYWVETGWRDGPLTRERVFLVTHLGEVVLVRPCTCVQVFLCLCSCILSAFSPLLSMSEVLQLCFTCQRFLMSNLMYLRIIFHGGVCSTHCVNFHTFSQN